MWVGAYSFLSVPFSKWLPGGHIGFFVFGLGRRHGFHSITRVCFGIWIFNFMSMSSEVVSWSLLIFSTLAFKMTAWQSNWIYRFPGFNFNLVWLWISSPNLSSTLLVCLGKSVLSFSDVTFIMAAWWPYWIFWFLDSSFSFTSNIKSKLE